MVGEGRRHQEQYRILVTHREALSRGTSQGIELFPMKAMPSNQPRPFSTLKLPLALYIFRVWTKFPAYDRRDTAHIQAQKDLRKMESNKRERRRNSWCLEAERLLVRQVPLSKCSQRNQGGNMTVNVEFPALRRQSQDCHKQVLY